MPINQAFDQQHRAMKALYETMERDQTWDSPDQRMAGNITLDIPGPRGSVPLDRG